jgi:DNA-binding NarL/FixJ family response regulator
MGLTGVCGCGSPRAMVWLPVPSKGSIWRTIDGVTTSVLIVDDHPGFRASARRMLEASGYAVVGEAADGAAAIAAVGELDPDLVLLDVQLPDLDGFEVAARLRALGEGAEIVLTSSRDRSDFGTAVEESPARGFIAKAELSGPALAELIG